MLRYTCQSACNVPSIDFPSGEHRRTSQGMSCHCQHESHCVWKWTLPKRSLGCHAALGRMMTDRCSKCVFVGCGVKKQIPKRVEPNKNNPWFSGSRGKPFVCIYCAIPHVQVTSFWHSSSPVPNNPPRMDSLGDSPHIGTLLQHGDWKCQLIQAMFSAANATWTLLHQLPFDWDLVPKYVPHATTQTGRFEAIQ